MGRPRRGLCGLLALAVLVMACAESAPPTLTLAPELVRQDAGSQALFIGISIVDPNTVWLAGTGGTWARTTDGGATWTHGVVPGADSLQFRDVHAASSARAWLLSIGNGDRSRIYRTDDGGATWMLQFTNPTEAAFYDCFDFWDAQNGIAFSDAVDGAFVLLATQNGGVSWEPIPAERLPPATQGEGSFAASGTCLVAAGDSTAWIGTGASDGAARVLRTTDRGRSWSVASTPIVRGTSAGIASLAFRDPSNGAALGGDISLPDSTTQNVAITRDGGVTWTAATPTPFAGAAYGAAWVPGAPSPTLVAVGPGGIAYSTDEAVSWVVLDTLSHWSVRFAAPDRGWAVGPGGRITRIRLFTAN